MAVTTAVTTSNPVAVRATASQQMTGIHALAAAASATQKLKMSTSSQVRIVAPKVTPAQPIRIIQSQPREPAPVSVVGGIYLFKFTVFYWFYDIFFN